MELQDAVKLIYQSEFGGGHLIMDEKESLERLLKEYRQGAWKQEGCKNGELVEKAGKGMCRISLRALEQGLSPETLNRMFVRSAGEIKGTTEVFEKNLEELVRLSEDGILPFDGEEARRYCLAYKEQGYPAVSHSRAYRELYHPAYRIVDGRYGEYLAVFLALDQLLSVRSLRKGHQPCCVISIDGMSGSGKSSLAGLLKGIYSCNVFHIDDYFLQPQQRTGERLGEPGGNVDYERFKKEILDHVEDAEGLAYQVYDCGQQRLSGCVRVPYRELQVVEGSYSQHPYFGDVYDLRIFLEADEATQKARILKRNGEFMLRRFVNEWIPMENRYFRAFKIREKADVVLTSHFQMI